MKFYKSLIIKMNFFENFKNRFHEKTAIEIFVPSGQKKSALGIILNADGETVLSGSQRRALLPYAYAVRGLFAASNSALSSMSLFKALVTITGVTPASTAS